MIRFMSRLVTTRRAATSIEYGLICALIVVAMMVGIRSTGSGSASMWSNMTNKVSTVMN